MEEGRLVLSYTVIFKLALHLNTVSNVGTTGSLTADALNVLEIP
jgi:hypothetical protein